MNKDLMMFAGAFLVAALAQYGLSAINARWLTPLIIFIFMIVIGAALLVVGIVKKR